MEEPKRVNASICVSDICYHITLYNFVPNGYFLLHNNVSAANIYSSWFNQKSSEQFVDWTWYIADKKFQSSSKIPQHDKQYTNNINAMIVAGKIMEVMRELLMLIETSMKSMRGEILIRR